MASDARWLLDGDGVLWLAWEDASVLSVGKWSDGRIAEDSKWWEVLLSGWDAAIDNKGRLWVTWSEEGPVGALVYVRRFSDGAWGPRFQISTTGSNLDPIIAPDEYGNVWIFWERKTEVSDIVMCRMGLRSGQETLVARDASRPRSALTRQGAVFVTFGEHDLYVVTGTEHGGFGEPVRV